MTLEMALAILNSSQHRGIDSWRLSLQTTSEAPSVVYNLPLHDKPILDAELITVVDPELSEFEVIALAEKYQRSMIAHELMRVIAALTCSLVGPNGEISLSGLELRGTHCLIDVNRNADGTIVIKATEDDK